MTSMPRRNRARERSVGFIGLGLLAGFMLAAGVVIAVYFLPDPDLLFKADPHQPGPSRLVHYNFHDGELLVPSNLIARTKRSALGSLRQIDVQLPWPYRPDRVTRPPEQLKDLEKFLLLSFEQRPAEHNGRQSLARIYSYYIAGKPVLTPQRMYRYQFRPDTPYGDLELYAARLGNQAIYIRCSKRASSLGPVLCESQIDLSPQVSVRYRFPRAQLGEWKDIRATVVGFTGQVFHQRK